MKKALDIRWNFYSDLKDAKIQFLPDTNPNPHVFYMKIWRLIVKKDNDISVLLDNNDIVYKSYSSFWDGDIIFDFRNEEDLNIAKLLV